MLETRRLELQSQMDAALATGDTVKVEALRRTIDRETLECTAHTAERVKRVEADVREIKTDVREIKATLTAHRNRYEGAKLLWDTLKVLVGAGGATALIKALGG